MISWKKAEYRGQVLKERTGKNTGSFKFKWDDELFYIR